MTRWSPNCTSKPCGVASGLSNQVPRSRRAASPRTWAQSVTPAHASKAPARACSAMLGPTVTRTKERAGGGQGPDAVPAAAHRPDRLAALPRNRIAPHPHDRQLSRPAGRLPRGARVVDRARDPDQAGDVQRHRPLPVVGGERVRGPLVARLRLPVGLPRRGDRADDGRGCGRYQRDDDVRAGPVSYTHLTLPTIYSV